MLLHGFANLSFSDISRLKLVSVAQKHVLGIMNQEIKQHYSCHCLLIGKFLKFPGMNICYLAWFCLLSPKPSKWMNTSKSFNAFNHTQQVAIEMLLKTNKHRPIMDRPASWVVNYHLLATICNWKHINFLFCFLSIFIDYISIFECCLSGAHQSSMSMDYLGQTCFINISIFRTNTRAKFSLGRNVIGKLIVCNELDIYLAEEKHYLIMASYLQTLHINENFL